MKKTAKAKKSKWTGRSNNRADGMITDWCYVNNTFYIKSLTALTTETIDIQT